MGTENTLKKTPTAAQEEQTPFVENTRQKLMAANDRLAAIIKTHSEFSERLQGNDTEVCHPSVEKPNLYGVRGIDEELNLIFQQIDQLEDLSAQLSHIA